MEEVISKPTVDYIPPLPQKTKKNTTFTQITSENDSGHDVLDGCANVDLSSMHSLVLNSKTPPATVFVAATQPDRAANKPGTDVLTKNGPHVVTIRINPDTDKSKIPKISSVHLKADAQFDSFEIKELCKKNNSLVRLNVDERPKIIEEDAKPDKPPYIYCNSYLNTSSNMVMSSGQCSPSDTLDSGTCSDLDGTPPPLPKKKTSKSTRKTVSVTVIKSSNGPEDFEDNESNLSYDSLNSSELNGSVHADDISNHNDYNKKDKKSDPPAAQQMPLATKTNKDFLPRGLLQDIRERSVKLNTVETESDLKTEEEFKQNINENANVSKESAQLTSFRLVSQFNSELNKDNSSKPQSISKTPVIVSESTYEERKKEDKIRQESICYSTHYFDTDKFYDFHLNEKQFDDVKSVKSASVDRECDNEVVYFAGIKDFKSDEAPSTIKSSKGTIRGVKNRVRAGIATFLQMQNTNVKSYREKDAGKVVLYTTTMGIVRSTYQRCVLVKKILRNLMVKYEERDVFMSMEYQDEIRERMESEDILVPQLYIDGMHIGDADTVEKLNESGELRKMLKPYKSPDACTTCQMCGGFRLLPCRICNGSKKSLHRNHFTAEFVALKCMNCDEVGLVRCEACS